MTSPGQQQLPAADHLLPGGHPLRVVRVVAAPADVHRPDLTGGEAEPGRADVQQGGRVQAGAAVPALAQVGAGGQRLAAAAPVPCPSGRRSPGSPAPSAGSGRRSRSRSARTRRRRCWSARPGCASGPRGRARGSGRAGAGPTSSAASTTRVPAPALVTVTSAVDSIVRPSSVTWVTTNSGDQSRPARDPLRPGRPTQPVRCSGSSASRIGGSTVLPNSGRRPERDQCRGALRGDVFEAGPPVQDGGQLTLRQVEHQGDLVGAEMDHGVGKVGHDLLLRASGRSGRCGFRGRVRGSRTTAE